MIKIKDKLRLQLVRLRLAVDATLTVICNPGGYGSATELVLANNLPVAIIPMDGGEIIVWVGDNQVST